MGVGNWETHSQCTYTAQQMIPKTSTVRCGHFCNHFQQWLLQNWSSNVKHFCPCAPRVLPFMCWFRSGFRGCCIVLEACQSRKYLRHSQGPRMCFNRILVLMWCGHIVHNEDNSPNKMCLEHKFSQMYKGVLTNNVQCMLYNVHYKSLQVLSFRCNYQMQIRLPALYSTDDGSQRGCFFHVGGKKIKNKNCLPADVGGKKK